VKTKDSETHAPSWPYLANDCERYSEAQLIFGLRWPPIDRLCSDAKEACDSTVHAGCRSAPGDNSRPLCASHRFGADKRPRHSDCCTHDQAGDDRLRLYSSPIKEGQVMSKVTSTLIAALAALTLSGGAYAQAAGGSNGSGSSGSTAGPANQVNNGETGGYGTPGATNSGSGMGARAPNSGLPSSTNSTTSGTSAPKSNNTLATPSVVSPGAGQQ
jgi:hypothetical protein